jgi:hypothetical protein
MRTGADIINRIDEQQHLLTFLRSHGGAKKTLVLQSPAGFGKSHLIDRVISQLDDTPHYLIIGRGTKYDGTTYIQQLAATVNDCARRTGSFLTLTQFRQMLQSKELDPSLALMEEAIKPVGDIMTGAVTLGTVGSAFKAARGFLASFAATETPEDEIVAGSNSDSIKFCERYARYVVGRNSFILRVNGYDAIGEESDFYLRNLYGNAKNLTLILEVTDHADERDALDTRVTISDRFPGGSTEYRKLDKVSVEHVIDYYQQTLDREPFDIPGYVRDAFTSSGGNFRRFKFLLEDKFKRQPTSEGFASSEERILALVKELPPNGKRLLALAAVAPTDLNSESIQEIWLANDWTTGGDLTSALNLLSRDFGALVSIESGSPALTAEFIRAYLLRCPPLETFRLEARRVLLAQLRQENLSSESNDRTYSNLLCIISLAIQGGGSSDAALLPSSLRDLDLGRYPSNKVELAKSVRRLFHEYVYRGRQAASAPGGWREYDSVYEEICKILYRIGDIDTLMEIFDAYSAFLPLEAHRDQLRLSIISAKISSSRREAIGDLEAINRENLLLYVGSRLLLIKYHRTFGFLRKAKREWRRLRDGGEIDKTPFEGLLYEYGALLHPINLFYRLRFLVKAKRRHLANNNDFHAVASSLGIAATYLHIPWLQRKKLAWAEKELSSVKGLLPQVRITDHILENNTAIAELLNGDRQSRVLEKLMFAYDRCTLKADKLLIGANLIECFMKVRQREPEAVSIAVYVNDILAISRIYQNRNSEFALYALSTCYRYFRFMDDRLVANEINELDLANMPMHLLFHNFGSPRTALARLFVRWIYSRLYVIFWPRVHPVFNWSIDFYSFQWHSRPSDERS